MHIWRGIGETHYFVNLKIKNKLKDVDTHAKKNPSTKKQRYIINKVQLFDSCHKTLKYRNTWPNLIYKYDVLKN